MRDYLLDLVSHTYDLGLINLIKVTADDKATAIEAIAEDKSIVLNGRFHNPIADFVNTFGMPNLGKLKIILNLQEYKENADITVIHQERNSSQVPVGLHFENATKDFQNDYRFMTPEVINDQLKTAKFRGATWHYEFEPTMAGIQRLKMQAQANAEENTFAIKCNGKELRFIFGDHSTHAGDFVFHHLDSKYALKRNWQYPIKAVISIFDSIGDKVVRISDDGAMQITVDSGLAEYNYILPAHSK
jgi:hypothetical protein